MKLVAVLLACAGIAMAADELSGRRAPGFSLPDSNFKRYDLQDYRGKWLLIEFLVTECPHCKRLSKSLEQVKAKFGDKVALLSVAISPPETRVSVTKYIAENEITVPIVFDQGQMAASYFDATPERRTLHTPHLFVINPAGMIVRDFGHSDDHDGLLDPPGLIQELTAVFAAKPEK